MFRSLVIILAFILSSLFASAQNDLQLTSSFESMFSSGERTPFWLTSNQSGKYQHPEGFNQFVSVSGNANFKSILETKLNIQLGGHLIANYSEHFNYHANELYASADLYGWKLQGGLFREPDYFNRLSSSNGNLDRSNNARPYPRIRFGTDEFIPFLFFKDWFRIKAEYDEGLLDDKRIVENTHLHHKSLYLKALFSEKSSFSFGLNHWVMWGGSSPRFGELPGVQYYLTYVLGMRGTEAFPTTDQFNVAGNQFGTYHLQIDFPLWERSASFYISHPFEDHSGMELFNARDNLYGLFIDVGKKQILEKVVYEFMYTLHQSGHIHQFGVMNGRDNYYNHGVYNSGYTYRGMGMMSPLFSPLLIEEDVVKNILNNRISMHHLGLNGSVTDQIRWDGKFTYSRNLGTYNTPIDPIAKQFSSLLNFTYSGDNFPVDIYLSVAADIGNLYEKRVGCRLGVSKSF